MGAEAGLSGSLFWESPTLQPTNGTVPGSSGEKDGGAMGVLPIYATMPSLDWGLTCREIHEREKQKNQPWEGYLSGYWLPSTIHLALFIFQIPWIADFYGLSRVLVIKVIKGEWTSVGYTPIAEIDLNILSYYYETQLKYSSSTNF